MKNCKATANTKISATMSLLQEFGIAIDEVAEYAGVPPKIANAALQNHCMETCPVIVLIKVQAATEILLRNKGWRGDTTELWRDFYAMLESAAAGLQT